MILTDVAYISTNGKSVYSYVMISNNLPIYAGAHFGLKLSFAKNAAARVILFALEKAAHDGFSKIVAPL